MPSPLEIPLDPSYFLPPSDSTREEFAATVKPLYEAAVTEDERATSAVYELPGLPRLSLLCGIARNTATGEQEPLLGRSESYPTPVPEDQTWQGDDILTAYSAHYPEHAAWIERFGKAYRIAEKLPLLALIEDLLADSPHPLERAQARSTLVVYNDKTFISSVWKDGDEVYRTGSGKTARLQDTHVHVREGEAYEYQRHADGHETLTVESDTKSRQVTAIVESETGAVTYDVAGVIENMRQTHELGLDQLTDGKLARMTSIIRQAQTSGIRLLNPRLP
jgi:hypothetical protein